MADRLWCPTRGYFEIGEGGGPAGSAGAAETPAEAPAETSGATSAEDAPEAGPAPPAAAGAGGRVWAPTRGYFEVGGGAPAAPAAKAEPKKTPAASASAPASEPAGAAAASAVKEKPAPPKAKVAKAPAKKAAPATKAAPAAVEADPERDSVTTVPRLAEAEVLAEAGKTVYDAPDSETTLYRVSTLNILFAISSAALLLWTVLVLWQDYDRPWKHIQKDAKLALLDHYSEGLHEVSARRLEELAQLERPLLEMLAKLGVKSVNAPGVPNDDEPAEFTKVDNFRFQAMSRRIRSLIGHVRDRLEDDERYVELRKAMRYWKNEAEIAEKGRRFHRGDYQAAKSERREEKSEIVLRAGGTGEALERLGETEKEHVAEWEAEAEAWTQLVEKTEKAARKATSDFEEYVRSRTTTGGDPAVDLMEVENAATVIEQAVNLEEKKVQEVEDDWRNAIRNGFLTDFLAPTIKIDKVVINDLYEDLNFLHAPRVDRCRTCHVNIDSPDPMWADFHNEDWGSVYASHPRLDLYLAGTAAHPYEEFGCTGCHYGVGRATDFTIAAHIPGDAREAEKWERKYDWHELHHQDFPMYSEHHLTASCRKCHGQEDHVDGADTYNLGLEIVRRYGCYGCHRIEGFDVVVHDPENPKKEEDLWKRNKAGPSLRYVRDKVSRDFIYKWIRNPWHFRRSTRMPRFFDLSNNRDDGGELFVQEVKIYEKPVERDPEAPEVLEFRIRNDVEALSLAHYIYTKSEERSPPHPGIRGDWRRGREVFSEIGCLGCHSVREERETVDPETLEAPPLPEIAMVRKTLAAAAGKHRRAGAPLVAERLEEVSGKLVEMQRWHERLTPDKDVSTLYHEVRVPLQFLEGRLGEDDPDLQGARRLAAGIYDSWVHSTFAPDLSSIGSKFDLETEAGRAKAEAWLTDWIIQPSKHDYETVMPRLRLEEDSDGPQKVADIVAYLLTLRDPEFEKSDPENPVPTPDTLGPEHREALRDIVFDHLRGSRTTLEAREQVEGMSVRDQLLFAGHRLIRRYGCYGCHNGIRDDDPDAPLVDAGSNGGPPVAWFDNAQPIGTELNGWGNKPANRLDFGPWGHQPDGQEAIPHDRFAWLKAKLEDTRRFDVFPVEKKVDEDTSVFVVPDEPRLIQKKPDELLKMPLFPFHDNPEMVRAAVTFITSLVNDKIPLTKERRLEGTDRAIEVGARLVEKYNCAGCHRIGERAKTTPLDALPTFASMNPEDIRYAEMEKETWLSRPFRVERPLPPEAKWEGQVTLPSGYLLNLLEVDPAVDPQGDLADDNQLTAVQLGHRHFDPLPGFARQVVRGLSILQFEDEALAAKEFFDAEGEAAAEGLDPGIFAFVRKVYRAPQGQDSLTEFLKRIMKRAFPPPTIAEGPDRYLTLLSENPYHPDAVAWLNSREGEERQWETLARRYYGKAPARLADDQHRLPIRGLGEGGIRYYFGTDAETRTKAPPPLVRQGERVRGGWLFHFLLDVKSIRPWLKVRMPSFNLSHDEARALVAWFRAVYGLPAGEERFAEDTFDEAAALAGRELFEKELNCNKCHPAGESLPTPPILTTERGLDPEDIPITAPGDSFWYAFRQSSGPVQIVGGFADAAGAQAAAEKEVPRGASWAVGRPWSKASWGPDLSMAAERLRPPWIREWLMGPQRFMPGTQMPLFPNFNPQLSEESTRERQLRQILQYLIHMDRLGR